MGEIAAKFGQRIRYFRKERRLSQEQLAELCELHPTYIGQLERGEKNPTIETMLQLCKGLQVTPERLFENFPAEESESIPQKAYNLFMQIPPEKQQAMIELLEKAVSLIEQKG